MGAGGKQHLGFTLMEILMVISLIVTLAMILLPSLKGVHQDAQLDNAAWNLNVLKSGVESYYRHHLEFDKPYPSNITYDLQHTTPVVVKEILGDPFETIITTTPRTFGYQQNTDQKYYVIWSNGINQQTEWAWHPNATSPTEISLLVGSDDIVVSNLPVRKY